jgi:carboxypeptidase Taq
MSAQFYNQAALAAHPEIPAEIEPGAVWHAAQLAVDNIYQHGSKFTANELIERVTGGPLTIDPYVAYLNEKFGSLYGL